MSYLFYRPILEVMIYTGSLRRVVSYGCVVHSLASFLLPGAISNKHLVAVWMSYIFMKIQCGYDEVFVICPTIRKHVSYYEVLCSFWTNTSRNDFGFTPVRSSTSLEKLDISPSLVAAPNDTMSELFQGKPLRPVSIKSGTCVL